MSLVPSFVGRRVPIYIWLPIVLACATAGFVVGTLHPARGMTSAGLEVLDPMPATSTGMSNRSGNVCGFPCYHPRH